MRHKYNAQKTVVDGIKFDSKKEAMRYEHLKNLERVGKIDRLVLQPRYTLQDRFECSDGEKLRKIEYVADFEYEEDGVMVVEDVKGMKTDVYKLKRKWFKHNYDGVYVHREV